MAPKKAVEITLAKEKDTKRFVKFAIADEDGTADINGALYVRKGSELATAEKLVLTIKS
jgi:hypothetical protein